MNGHRIDLDAIGANGWADPDTVLALVAELRDARQAHDALVAFHDTYDSGTDRFKVRGRLWQILRAWDGLNDKSAS